MCRPDRVAIVAEGFGHLDRQGGGSVRRRNGGIVRSASVLTGRRLSRREVLRAAAASGIAAIGAAGVASAVVRTGTPKGATAVDQLFESPIADLAGALAYDVEAMFRFVADDVAYHPYAGALRGARGTLAARAGNSVDKALLLGALLEASLVTYRFATGPIDAAAVIGLEAAMRPSRASSRGVGDRRPGGDRPRPERTGAFDTRRRRRGAGRVRCSRRRTRRRLGDGAAREHAGRHRRSARIGRDRASGGAGARPPTGDRPASMGPGSQGTRLAGPRPVGRRDADGSAAGEQSGTARHASG